MAVCQTYAGPSLDFRNMLLKLKEIFSHFYVTFVLSALAFARKGFYRKQIVIQWMLPTVWHANYALLPATSVKHVFLHSPHFPVFMFLGDGYLIDVALRVCLHSVAMVIAFWDNAVLTRCISAARESRGCVQQCMHVRYVGWSQVITLRRLPPQPSCCKQFHRTEWKTSFVKLGFCNLKRHVRELSCSVYHRFSTPLLWWIMNRFQRSLFLSTSVLYTDMDKWNPNWKHSESEDYIWGRRCINEFG